jgi:hypothetical protein
LQLESLGRLLSQPQPSTCQPGKRWWRRSHIAKYPRHCPPTRERNATAPLTVLLSLVRSSPGSASNTTVKLPGAAASRNMSFTFFSIFTLEQRRNIIIYIVGIVFYKLALEYFNGSSENPFVHFFIRELIIPNPGAFITMANERFGDQRYQKIGMYLLRRH